jgi:hypothetical protein
VIGSARVLTVGNTSHDGPAHDPQIMQSSRQLQGGGLGGLMTGIV